VTGKNGRILFDRPKPTVGCSANGRRRRMRRRRRRRRKREKKKKEEEEGYVLRGKGGRCVGLTTLLPSSADCVAILRA
jgi:hypothetical protein